MRRACGNGQWGTHAFAKLGAHVKIRIGGHQKRIIYFHTPMELRKPINEREHSHYRVTHFWKQNN